MRQAVSLMLVLLGVWLALSGIFTGLLISLGVLSSLVVVLIALRMNVVDHEGYPAHLEVAAVVRYGCWLTLEIIKSNVDVARRIISPSLPISPTVFRVHSSQRTKLGQVIFANSITLTPGTVSINLWETEIRVHALTEAAASALRDGAMDRRVTALEGEAGDV